MRLTGPGMSLAASGTMAKTLTFSIWKGQAYGRLRVIPVNRNTTDQKTVRSVLGTIAKSARAVLTSYRDIEVPALGSQFFVDGNVRAPAGQSWISFMQKVLNSQFASLVIAYGVLTSVADLYEAEAADMGMSSYIDKSLVTHTAGEQLYLLAAFASGSLSYLGFADGIDSATAPQLTAFATYVQTSVSA